MVLMNMAQAQDKQGYLGNLECKSTAELKELLLRQQKLLGNQAFIQRLSDKGEKITKLVDRIHMILSSQGDVDNTAELLEKLQLDADRNRQNRTVSKEAESEDDEENDGESSALKMMVNKGTTKKMVTDERTQQPATDTSSRLVNSYQKIIRKDNSPGTKMSKFKLHSSLRVRELERLPDKLRGPSAGSHMMEQDLPNMEPCQRDIVVLEPSAAASSTAETDKRVIDVTTALDVTANVNKMKPLPPKHHVYDEALEVKQNQSGHKTCVKLLSLEESFLLQQQHHKLQQELHAKQAAEKLAGRLGQLTKYSNPEGSSDMRYRDNPAVDTDEESEEEVDYPD